MITSRHLIDWIIFALIAIAFCIVLAFRPIPSASSTTANDTGRYVQMLHQYCQGGEIERAANKESSYGLFYAAVSPACWVESDELFMFEVATFLPLIFLLFSKWRQGTIVWSLGLLFSVFGIELMTNAMRQEFGMFFFFWAISLIERHRRWAYLVSLVAGLAHSSVLIFIPYFVWISGFKIPKRIMLASALILLLSVMFSVFVFGGEIIEFFRTVSELREIYSSIYSEQLKLSFILFMILPLLWIYGIRHIFERKGVTKEEIKGIQYSTIILGVTYVLFPYITFRVAIFSVVLQLFLITRSESQNIKVAGYAFVALFLHLLFMVITSDYHTTLVYG